MKTRIYVLVIVTLIILLAGFTFFSKRVEAPIAACTMDAKICPDGSAVGRTGPNCEFAKCPEEPNSIKTPKDSTIQDSPIACSSMDVKVCPDGSVVKRFAPNCEFAKCPEPSPQNDLIRVTSPVAGSNVTSPLTISGTARGTWFFEGSFPISVVNWDGLVIGEGVATAQGEWMTEDFVPFTATITYTIDPQTPYNRGTIILKKDNPSGLPEKDDTIEVPVVFGEVKK